MTGHAICNGDISSTSEKLNWDALKNTLYHNQPLINLLNMVAGDQKYIGRLLRGEDNRLIYSNVNGNIIVLNMV